MLRNGVLAILALAAVVAFGVIVGREAPASAGAVVVNTAADPIPPGDCQPEPGGCSLREAILDAVSGDTIAFNIPGAGPHVIRPTETLPALSTASMTVDGYTQPGASPNSADAFEPGNADIRIVLDGSEIESDEKYGLWVGGSGVTIRGLSIVNFPDEAIKTGTFPSAVIQGNYIGVWPDGETAGPNRLGIDLRSSQFGNQVGGNSPDDRNVISGNDEDGVWLRGSTSVSVSGNFVGTDASGAIAVPNGGHGINLEGATGSTIGGSSLAAGNLASGNGQSGIAVGTPEGANLNIKGNRIGTAANGTSPLGNSQHGVFLDREAHDNTIGGEFNVGEQNIIAFNGMAGVALTAAAGVNNYIDPSVTHSNGGLGTDLKVDGISANDLAVDCGIPQDGFPDCDSGPNSMMNFPILTAATYDGVTLSVTFDLDTRPNDFVNVFVFANQACDPSGYGEGERFLGARSFNTGGTGEVTITRTFPNPALIGMLYITMSASDPESTSEFSPCFEIDFTGTTPTATPTPSPSTTPIPTATPTATQTGSATATQTGSATATPTPTVSPSATVTPAKHGDFTCDGVVDEVDALALLEHYADLDGLPKPAGLPDCVSPGGGLPGGEQADADCDGELTPLDALRILLAMQGLDLPGVPPLCPPVDV